MAHEGERLFSDFPLERPLGICLERMHHEIDTIDPDQLLSTSIEDWCEYLVSKWSIDMPHLKEDEIFLDDPKDVPIDISRNPDYGAYGEPRPVYKKGTSIIYHVPFDGNGHYFTTRPTTITDDRRIG